MSTAARVVPRDPGLPSIRCANGHLGPPESAACRVCGRPITDRSITYVHRPQLGRLRRSGAPDLPVAGPIVFGRQPEWDGVGEQPLLITVDDSEQTISRSHLAVRVTGWQVVVTDLGGQNGSVLKRPSGHRQQLVPQQPVAIVPSSSIILAGIITVAFEVP